ncbi:methyltransferase TYW3-domain-containing protein [Xylariaceae sp. FL0662B]|nr:methyltransferase TYW3-domain-containing protein [Xylariaceae sp. FL0662B]
MKGLPLPPPNFTQRKNRILELLSIPDSEYTDASPKGSVDAGIRDLIDEINRLSGFVTTSSCAGRVSVFLEGKKVVEEGLAAPELGVSPETPEEANKQPKLAGVGGKGGGGAWLFVSHDPVLFDETKPASSLEALLGLKSPKDTELTLEYGSDADIAATRLIHFKFEPMILHILTASPEHAQLLLRCGLQAGFRESGAINLTAPAGDSATPIVAIRTMGLALESLVGIQTGEDRQCTVSSSYLLTLVRIANERFSENKKRIERFRMAILEATRPARKGDGAGWEDTQARRERKRAEGLRRKAELQSRQRENATEQAVLDTSFNADLT